jgi:hypothetical protein
MGKLPKIVKNNWKKYYLQAKKRKFNRHEQNIQRIKLFIEKSQPKLINFKQ